MNPPHLKSQFILIGILFIFLFSSCSSVGLLSEGHSWIVEDITSVRDFLMVSAILQGSIFIVALVLSLIFARAGLPVSFIAHFAWIIVARDYGFLNVLLLFFFFAVVNYLIRWLTGTLRPSDYY